MVRRRKATGWAPDQHRRGTEGRLLAGGFGLILVVGGGLIWLLIGPVPALIGVGVMLAAVALFVVLIALLKALERWAKS